MGFEGIPANCSKGPVLKATDAQLNARDEAGNFVKRAEILNLLSNWDNNYVDLLKTVFQVPTVAADYVGVHWYNDNPDAPETWWKEKQPIEPIVRQSLISAIEMAGDLPIDSYWVPIGNRSVHPNKYHQGLFRADEYPFEVVLSLGQWQLTRLVITPPSPRPLRMETYNTPSNLYVLQDQSDPYPQGETTAFDNVGVVITKLYEQDEQYTPNY